MTFGFEKGRQAGSLSRPRISRDNHDRTISSLLSLHRLWKHVAMIFAVLTLSIANIGMAWGTSYIPGTRKVVTSNETIEYSTFTSANATTEGKWIVNPRGGTTSGKKYTNVNGDANGNPNGITDNIASIVSNVEMATIQVPSTAKYNQSGKYVFHMRITGITGMIVHGVTGSSGRGVAIYGQEYSNSLTENTEYGSALASMTRSSNSGSFILQYSGFNTNKEYLITVAATGGDVSLYAIELIAGVVGPTHSLSVTTNNALYGSVSPTSATVAENATTEITATPSSGYMFDHWTVSGTGATLSSTTSNPTTFTMGTADAIVTAHFTEWACPTHGSVFSLAMNNVGTTKSIGENEYVDLSSYATIIGGSAIFGSTASGKGEITKASPGKLKFGGNAVRLQLNLDCPLQEGDTIIITAGESVEISFTTNTTYASTPATSSKKYVIPAASPLIGLTTIYLWRASTSTINVTAININRPITCTPPTATFSNGNYRIGAAGLNLSSLWTSNSSGAVTYTVKNANGTGASIAGTSFTATSAGTAVVTARQAADGDYCEKVLDANIVVEEGCANGIYSFHTGSGTDEYVKTNNTETCFERVGSTTEWQITNYTIPNHEKFFVGNGGYFYNDNLGSNNSHSVINPWSSMYFALTQGDGTHPMVGQATGAIGTLRIYSDSDGDNLYVGFIPDGYVLKFGSTESPFTVYTGNEYRSGMVEYNGSTANNNVSVGIANGSGNYVSTDNTQEMRHIFVKDNVGWKDSNAKLAIYYWGGASGWCGFLTTVPNDASLFEGWIPSNATSIKLVRYNSSKDAPGDWNDIWNQTGDITLSSGNNLFTITAWDNQTTGWSVFSNKGKFRMNADWNDKNWYVRWVPSSTVYNFSNGNFHDWGTCAGGNLTLDGSQTGINYQLYKDGVAIGAPKAGTGSSIRWHVDANGIYTVHALDATDYAETEMNGSADVQLQNPTLTGSTSVEVGSTITLEHAGYLISGGSWDTSDPSIATVSAAGVVTGVAAGTVTITFHGVGGFNEDGSSVALCNGTITITVEASDENCEVLSSMAATSTSAFTASVGSVTYANLETGSSISLDDYSYAIELANDGNVVLSPKAGKTFAARDSLIVVVYNPTSSTATTGFVINDDVYEASCAPHQLHYFRQLLTAKNITYGGGDIILEHHEDAQIVAAWVKHCEVAGGCTEYIWKASDAEQVGSGSPYLYEVTGVGAAMRNATGGSSISFNSMSPACGSSNKMFTTGSNKFAFKTYNTITGITIYGSGTGSNRTLSDCRVGSTTSNYASVEASTDDAFETSGQCDEMHIVFENEIAANSYIEITFSGNVNISAIKTEYCTTCDGTQLIPSSSSIAHTYGDPFTEPTFELREIGGTLISATPALTYESSNTEIATVNSTTGVVSFIGGLGTVTITATYHGEGNYCESSASYTIVVSCAGGESAPKVVPAAGTSLTGCNSSITLYARQQDGSVYSSGTFRWYRDGEEIEGATTDTYVVLRAGTYTVTYIGTCTQTSTNSAVITNEQPEPTVERLVPFQYYHVNKTYTTQMKMRHLFAVKSIGTYNGKSYSMTATRNGVALDLTSGYDDVFMLIEGSGSDPDTVMIDLNELNGKFSAGDEIEFTCSAVNCNAISPVNEDITMYVIDAKPTLAYICSGADGAGTRNKKNFKYNGDFLTGYNKADLCLQDGTTSFDAETELPFYTYIKTRYRVTPVNGYAPFRKLDYEPFDLLLLTDYPKATVNSITENKLDSMYVLADYRPMLSFKTHMVAKSPSSWAAKGFTTAPVVPKAKPQTSMNIVCYSHPMFNALAIGNEGVYRDNEEPDQVVYQMLTGGGYDKEKGIQGFELGDAGNFVTIAFTHYDAKIGTPVGSNVSWNAESDDRKLVAACERQANIEARMILISVNADALCKMTTAGMVVVDSALQYLLEIDPEKLADCSLIFNDNNGTGVWSDPLNWGPRYNQIPNADLGAHIIRPCTVDITTANTLNIKLEQTGKLTIPVGSALNVGSTIRRHINRTQVPTTVDDISIAANANGSGTLIFNNPAGDTKASVQMYSKAQTDGSDNTANWKWQYIGTPFNDVTDATINYYQSWIYRWTGSSWALVPKASGLTPFTGYCITHPEAGHTYNMTGTLATTATQEISVPAEGYMVVGNSWTAPIQIKNFEDGDFEGITVKSIYFFNTGSDPDGSGTVNENPSSEETRYAPATYISVPIHAATYVGDSIIPAMQGFYVVGGSSAGTLHLDYNKLVRPKKSWQNVVSGPMHAPRRIAAADGEPTVAKLWVCGTNYDDRLVVLEREDFTRTYDSGWDGEKWEGNEISPMVYALNEDGGQEAVTATPDMEGTLIGFRAGEDDEYTFLFNYDGMAEPIYLLDTDTKVYTRVLTGNTYTFTTSDKAAHNRFILTRTEGQQTPTGWSNFTGEEDKVVKFINNGKLFIFVHGVLYDATGKVVR